MPFNPRQLMWQLATRQTSAISGRQFFEGHHSVLSNGVVRRWRVANVYRTLLLLTMSEFCNCIVWPCPLFAILSAIMAAQFFSFTS